VLPAFLTVILWSLSVVCAARAAAAFGGAFANRWRLVVAIGLLVGLLAWAGTMPSGDAFLWLLASGAVGLGIGDLAMYRGYEVVGARLIALMTQCLAAPIAGVLEWVWLGTAPRPLQIAWIAVTLAGVGMALGPRSLPAVSPARLRRGLVMGLLSAGGLALAGVLTRRAGMSTDGSGELLIGFDGGIGAAFARNLGGAVAAFVAGWMVTARSSSAPAAAGSRRHGWWWLVGTAVCGPALGVLCYQWALLESPAATVQAVLALVPVVVMPLAWFSEGDRPSLWAWIGAALALAGSVGIALG
jgi:drug/metabolite transporter (DMT)-like permease